MSVNTMFLRLEGPLQSWGDQQSKFVIRRTAAAPTKSGVMGILCAALGVPRADAPNGWLPRLCALRMGVRMDLPGVRWWDYHTVGARLPMRTAEGRCKPGAMLTRREYLCDASFLVALQGEPDLIAELQAALTQPAWTLYLGRKSCPPSRPVLEKPSTGEFTSLLEALQSHPWRPRFREDTSPPYLDCLLDWQPPPLRAEGDAVEPPLRAAGDAVEPPLRAASAGLKPGSTDGPTAQADAPDEALIWYDVPRTFDPPSHEPRFVLRARLEVGTKDGVQIGEATQTRTSSPPRPRADYANSEYRERRRERLSADHHLCVFCKSPADTVQHITYRRAGGGELKDDLRSLCRLCHDAVTMIEYGLGMGLDRINPEDPRWGGLIRKKREEIIKFRSLETRRRHLVAEEVE